MVVSLMQDQELNIGFRVYKVATWLFFYRVMLCIAPTMLSQDIRPFICLSVRLSVTRRYSVETAK